MTKTITIHDIEELQEDAARFGDLEMYAICECALAGSGSAWDVCEAVIKANAALSKEDE